MLSCLLKARDVYKKINKINFKNIDSVVFIHSIGVDKFEHMNYPKIEPIDSIDKDVYNSNVNTFKNIVRPLVKKIEEERSRGKKISLKLSIIGSVADKHDVLMLTSFSESKNIVRAYMRNLTNNYKWISAFVINVSSTITKSAIKVRPYSDTKYWLTPEDIVKKSADKLIASTKKYKEIDIFKVDPGFENDYYSDNSKIFKRWMKYAKNKTIK